MVVPPLYLTDWAENVASFHRLVPFLISTNLACLRLSYFANFVSCSNRTSMDGVVCLKRSLISFHFFLPVNPWPNLRVFWVAMVILSPFISILCGVCWLLAQH